MGLKILHTYKSSMITSMITYKWSLIWLIKLYKTIYDDLMFLHFSWRSFLLRISPGVHPASSVCFADPRCGGGNAAQVVSCLFGSRYKVTAISLFADEAEKWDKAVKEAGGMTCNFQGTTKAAPWRTNFGIQCLFFWVETCWNPVSKKIWVFRIKAFNCWSVEHCISTNIAVMLSSHIST